MFEALLAILLLASCGWSAYVIAAWCYPAVHVSANPRRGTRSTGSDSGHAPAETSVRLAAAAVVGCWLLVAVFLGLATLGQFRISVAIGVWLAMAGALHVGAGRGRTALATARADIARARAVLGEWRESPAALVALAVIAALIFARLARSLVAPPLGWDSFTYHLVKPASWVQTGGFVTEAAPDAWGYYEYFQPYGEVLWAWAMLPVRGDALIGPAGLAVWASGLLGVYASARAFGAAMRPATLAALAVVLTPSVINFATTGYVDNTTLALFALSVAFLQRWFKDGAPVDALMAIGGLAVLGGVKFSSLPPAALGMSLVVVSLVVRRVRARRPVAGLLALGVLAGSLALPPYVRAWRDTGSPTYPFRVELAGVPVFAGNPQLEAVFARRVPTDVSVARALFVPDMARLVDGRQQFLNLGPAGAIVALFGLAAIVVSLRSPQTRVATAFLTVSSLVVIGALAGEDTASLRTVWLQVLGRRLMDPLVAAAILAAAVPVRSTVPLLWVAVASNTLLALPLGWSEVDAAALAAAAWPLLAMLLLLVALAFVSRLPAVASAKAGRSTPRLVQLAAIILLTAVVAWPRVREVRAASRYDYFRDATFARVYDAGRLPALTMESFTIWRFLDQETPTAAGHTVAVSAGWWENGHNWYRYPLYGTRLQNRVRYVPITSDGSVVDYRDADRAAARADYHAWVRRLMAYDIDYLVLLPPDPIEARWVAAHPELFQPVATGFQRRAHAYRFDRLRAAHVLDRLPFVEARAAR